MRSGLVRIVVQHEAGNDFGFADRRIGLLEDSFVEREKAQAGITPPVVVIGPVDGAGQSDHLGDSSVVRVSTVSSLRPHPSMKRWDAYNEFAQIRWAGIYVKTRHIKRAAFWAAL